MRRGLALAAAIGFLLVGAGSALASPPADHNPNGKMLGVIYPKGQGNKPGGSKNLVYHGGPVMTTNKTYLVFWGPADSWPAGYIDTINQYFADVAHDSFATTNVYSVGTQYSGIEYDSSVLGTVNDTSGYPASGCRDHGTTVCLTDGQLQTHLLSLIGTTLPQNTTTAYFIFTPPNVGSCGSGVGCAFKNFCAYHSWINTSGGGTVLYANMPYALQTAACDDAPTGEPGQHPNGSSGADATLDGASHEHNEMITDPTGTSWFTNGGLEQGDLCNFIYGTPLGGDLTAGTAFNQTINQHNYFIQEEWSNDGSACLQRYSG